MEATRLPLNRDKSRRVAYSEAIAEMQASPSGLAHYYNRHCAALESHPRLAADNDLAPTFPSLTNRRANPYYYEYPASH